MALTILYFAWVRELIGADREEMDVPENVLTVRDLAAWLGTRSQGHRSALSDLSRLRAAIDQVFVDFDATIKGAREVAFFPPVTGG